MPGVDGVWKIELDHFDYSNDISITMSRMSDSSRSSNNDGLNCMNAQSPFEPPLTTTSTPTTTTPPPTACEAGEQH
jgi:hypothetical protein